MVETSASGRSFPGYFDISEDIVPDADATHDLGSEDVRWNYLYAVLAVLTSLIVGGVLLEVTEEGYLYINETVVINGSLVSYGNVTADYFIGNGSQLTGMVGFDDTRMRGALPYLYNDSSSIYLNESTLNATIDARLTVSDTNCSITDSCPEIVYWADALLNQTIDARDSDTHIAGDLEYLFNDSTTMYLNETKLNETINALEINNYHPFNDTVFRNETDGSLGIIPSFWSNLYIQFSNIVAQVGNWSADKYDYYTISTSDAGFVNRSVWTTIDNYPAGCSAGNYVTTIGDTLTCNVPYYENDTDTTYTNNSFDLSQLSNSGNVDLTDYNITHNDNSGTVYGNNSEAFIRFNGSSLIIQVN